MDWKLASVVVLSTLLIGRLASGYEVAAVANGGTIRGVISVKGKGLKDEVLTIGKDTEYCGMSLPAEKYLVAPGGELQNAVVMLEGIERGKAFEDKGDIFVANKKCQFVPHVQVAPKGGTLKVKNDDPILHNSHFFLRSGETKKNVINLALPRQGLVIGKKKILRKAGLLSIECDAHDFMQAWTWVVEHPYAATTPADGSFSLDAVPPGSYKLRIWHEALGEKIVSVKVTAGKTTSVDVSF